MAVGFGDWQKVLDNVVETCVKNNDIRLFSELKENNSRLCFIADRGLLNISWIREYFKRCKQHYSDKSDDKAGDFRQMGNTHFQKRRYKEALDCYNKSVIYSPSDCSLSVELSMGLANRSAALLHLGYTQECLDDIDSAMNSCYPQHLLYKLYQRQATCQERIGNTALALEALENAKTALSQAKDLDQAKKERLLQEIDKSRKRLDLNRSCNGDTTHRPVQAVQPAPPCGYNSVIGQASSHVQLKVSGQKGRHLVANHPISRGEILIVERPFAAVLLPPHYKTHCHHCLAKLLNITPCHQCTEVYYCSSQCEQEAWRTYHQVECLYIDLMHSIGIAHLGLRIVLTAGLKFLLKFRSTYQPSDIPGLDIGGKYDHGYLSVYELMPHSDDMLPQDLLQYTMTAALLLEVLRETDFFRSHGSSEEGASCCETEDYIGGLLLRHICQLVCNAHAITELQVAALDETSLVDTSSQERVATAIYPTASLMNHACDPTIISSFDKNVLVVRSVKDVKAGEEIYNCYGPHHCRMSYKERQQVLQDQYFFHCHCTACESSDKQEDIAEALKCSSCGGPVPPSPSPDGATCPQCGHVTDFLDHCQADIALSQQSFVEGLQHLQENNIKGAIKSLQVCHHLRERHLYKYHRALGEVNDALARCYAITGEYDKSIKHLVPSVEMTEAVYGDQSIELANELQKYAEILVNARKIGEALKVAERAKDLFVLNYGAKHTVVMETEELIRGIQSVCVS